MSDKSVRNNLDLPLSTDGGNTFYQYLHTNFEAIDAALSKCNFAGGAIDPDADNDEGEGYAIGSKWHTDTAIWECTDASEGAAVWVQIYPATFAVPGTNVDFGSYEVRAQTFQSDVATGTAPLIIASATKVSNLNVQYLNSLEDTAFLKHSLATAENDFLIASGSGAFVKKTLAETKTALGLGSAAYTASTAYVTHSLATAENDFLVASGSGAIVKKTLAETKTILGIVAHSELLRKATAVIGDGVNVITTGIKGGFEVPCTGQITAARVMSLDATSGAIAISIWQDQYADGVPTAADSVDTFSIAASGTQSQETGLTIPVTAGDWITFNVDSVTSMKLIAIALTITPS